MKKIGFLIFAAALVVGLVVSNLFSFGRIKGEFFSFSFGGVHGSGNSTSERRDVTGFHGIEVGGVYQVEVTAQQDFSVTVEADDNLVPLIRTEVDGGILRIVSDKRISPKSVIRIVIAAPDIDDLNVSGAANVTVSDIKNAGLSIDASGASKVTVNGETEKLTVDVSGAMRVDAVDLAAVNATVGASGASQVTVNVSGDLRTSASGASRITYAGSPKNVTKKTSGASSVSPK